MGKEFYKSKTIGLCLVAILIFSGCSNIQIKSPEQKKLAAIGIKYTVNKILAKRPDISEEMLIAVRSLKTAINEGLPLSLLDSILTDQISAANLPPEDERLLLDLAILCYETVVMTDTANEQKTTGLLLADVIDQAIVEWQSSMAGAVHRSTEAIKGIISK